MSEWRAHGQNLGLLVLRRARFMFAWQHGWPKVQAGPPKGRLGKAVKHLGIEDHYEIFGGLEVGRVRRRPAADAGPLRATRPSC